LNPVSRAYPVVHLQDLPTNQSMIIKELVNQEHSDGNRRLVHTNYAENRESCRDALKPSPRFPPESLVPSQDVQSKIFTLSREGIVQFGQHYAVYKGLIRIESACLCRDQVSRHSNMVGYPCVAVIRLQQLPPAASTPELQTVCPTSHRKRSRKWQYSWEPADDLEFAARHRAHSAADREW
jgi:hypothetical protein